MNDRMAVDRGEKLAAFGRHNFQMHLLRSRGKFLIVSLDSFFLTV
jgi:hypothetical protein